MIFARDNVFKLKILILQKFIVILGWNDCVREKPLIARQAFLEWVINGKNKDSHLFMLMKQTRAQFKLALRCMV